MKRVGWAWGVAAVGLFVGIGMLVAGETRLFRIGIELWALPIVTGVAVLLLTLWLRWRANRGRRAVAEATEQAQAAAREAHRTFVGRLDHELKNPLTALRMGVVSVTDPTLAESMLAQVDRLASLVMELRKISEIDSYPLANEPVDVAEVTAEVLEAVVPEDWEAAVTFPRAPRPLPPVRGDRDLVFLALYNLVNNAVKYSAPGATLEIRGIEDRGHVVVDVSDTGRGIPAGEVDQVWGELARSSEV
ncbi:MAG: HAMP domain-containing sensor histidine kinase, partial [Propionibacteriaceae bacterium]|nr:HAMP domain-containing sensor histidine kinase [Propionibacteriaceae bacterium]